MIVNPLLKDTNNPIRAIVDNLVGKENPKKELISLAQGDPTAYGHLKPPEEAVTAVVRAYLSGNHNGYTASSGSVACRTALAAAHSCPNRPPLSCEDVYVTVGCSEAIEHCIAVLAAPGSNIILPRPGFPLYETLCQRHGVICRFYDLLPEDAWQIDIESIRRVADSRTAAVLINNPSNPCGAVYSREHLKTLIAVAGELQVPLLADEVYAGMTYGTPFVPIAEVAGTVPVFSVGALSKRWLVPGWRVGWLCLHDISGVLKGSGVRNALTKLCQISLGPSTPLQAAIPTILALKDNTWLTNVMDTMSLAAVSSVDRISKINGLSTVSLPQGAMYVLVRVDLVAFADCFTDVCFAEKLLEEESVLVLPGECFRAPGFIRIVTTVPEHVLQVAWDRIESFCSRHFGADEREAICRNPARDGHQADELGLPRVSSCLGGHEGLLLKPPKPYLIPEDEYHGCPHI
jgi:tyrosine aminotransferase